MSALPNGRSNIRKFIPLGICIRAQRHYQFSDYGISTRDQNGSSEPSPNARLESHSKDGVAKRIPASTLSYHWETVAPTVAQLRQADRFFLADAPVLLQSTPIFRTIYQSTTPEVAFLGRSNVGKSSLLNALMGRNICHTSSKPGRTKTMNFFAVGGKDNVGNPGKIVVLDMPGYGKGSREEWGPEIMKYLTGRKQCVYLSSSPFCLLRFYTARLRRAFLLVDPLHGLKRSDEELLAQFRKNAISHQVILSKVDRILLRGRGTHTESKLERNSANLREIYEQLRKSIQPGNFDGPEALGEIISCSAEKSLERNKRPGIDQIRWAVLAATGLYDRTRITSITSDIQKIDTRSGYKKPNISLLPSGTDDENYIGN